MKQGWDPLCQFLGKPVPKDVPFPRTNDTGEMISILFKVRMMAMAVFVVMPAFMMLFLARELRG